MKYRGSSLGFLWSLGGPLVLLVVYSVVFSMLVRVESPVSYPFFALSALLPWLFTARTIERARYVLLEHSAFLQKVYVPRVLFVASSLGVQLVEFLLSLFLFLLLALYSGFEPSWNLILLPLWMAMHLALLFGVALVLSVGTVFFRDLGPLVEIAMQVLFYLCPILYPAKLAENFEWGWLYKLNPLVGLLDGYRAMLLGTPWPGGIELSLTGAFSVLVFILGVSIFERQEAQAVKEL